MSNPRPRQPESPTRTIRLASLDPDLMSVLSDEERAEAARLWVPVVESPERLEIAAVLRRAGAFGAIVLEGMVQHHIQIGGQVGLQLLGPGEVVGLADSSSSIMLAESEWRAISSTWLALLGDEFLAAARRLPRLYARLQVRTAAQAERLATQLAICQLPRVEDRLMAMLWLLAEAWGRVTTAGTTLPLSLTHEALGALVGARRSTVTLALGQLVEQGALVHQDRGWLLLEPPAQVDDKIHHINPPRVLHDGPSEWTDGTNTPVPVDVLPNDELGETVSRLHADYARNAEAVRERLQRIVSLRARSAEIRERVRAGRALRKQPPPS